MSQRPRSLHIQARSAKESNTPTGPPEAPMHSEEGSAFDFMQHIPSPIIDVPPTTGHIDAAIVQSGGPLSAITVSLSSVPSIPMSGLPSILTPGPLSDAPFTSSSQKCPAPYDFMDQIPASQCIARNLPVQHITFSTQLQPRADIDERSDDTTADDSIPDSEEDLIQVRGIPTSTIEADSAGPSIRFALPEGSPTEDVPLSDDRIMPDPTSFVQRRVGRPRSILTNLPPMLSGTPAFNAALDGEAEVLRHLLIDMKQMKKELHRLNERLMRDYLILETLIMNIQKRPDDLEEPDI
ncbi:hypothetical protein EI94DRAFT_1702514 [Lactarius quietus]|nr:hypothetical protein EI94DRAFT_1702514 [Lactarius quietus]